MFYIKFCQWLDSNCRPLATALPTEPQPLPNSTVKLVKYFDSLFVWLIARMSVCKWVLEASTLLQLAKNYDLNPTFKSPILFTLWWLSQSLCWQNLEQYLARLQPLHVSRAGRPQFQQTETLKGTKNVIVLIEICLVNFKTHNISLY